MLGPTPIYFGIWMLVSEMKLFITSNTRNDLNSFCFMELSRLTNVLSSAVQSNDASMMKRKLHFWMCLWSLLKKPIKMLQCNVMEIFKIKCTKIFLSYSLHNDLLLPSLSQSHITSNHWYGVINVVSHTKYTDTTIDKKTCLKLQILWVTCCTNPFSKNYTIKSFVSFSINNTFVLLPVTPLINVSIN